MRRGAKFVSCYGLENLTAFADHWFRPPIILQHLCNAIQNGVDCPDGAKCICTFSLFLPLLRSSSWLFNTPPHRRSPLPSWTYLLSSALRFQRRRELDSFATSPFSSWPSSLFLTATPRSPHSSSYSPSSSILRRFRSTSATLSNLSNLSTPTTLESSFLIPSTLKVHRSSQTKYSFQTSLCLTASDLSLSLFGQSITFTSFHLNFNLHLPYRYSSISSIELQPQPLSIIFFSPFIIYPFNPKTLQTLFQYCAFSRLPFDYLFIDHYTTQYTILFLLYPSLFLSLLVLACIPTFLFFAKWSLRIPSLLFVELQSFSFLSPFLTFG